MRLTKLGHACVRLEKDGAVLIIDPGVWSGSGVLDDASAVLITHEHPDHLDQAQVSGALEKNRDLRVWTNSTVAAQLSDFSSQVRTVAHGDTFAAAGFDVHVYGTDHAEIYREIPIIANTGFAVDGEVFHPGDALTVPEDPIPTLLVPLNAPWLKVSEMIDYVRAAAPQRGYGIHDGLLNANGIGLIENLLRMAPGPGGGEVARLEPGTAIDL
ncbi:MAG: MBL fold metallo-hydrolase [Streptosporangiaceae bacterium]|jgi:L-ascorbate metabolism protein UlaG (beta-lactamase superfamily)